MTRRRYSLVGDFASCTPRAHDYPVQHYLSNVPRYSSLSAWRSGFRVLGASRSERSCHRADVHTVQSARESSRLSISRLTQNQGLNLLPGTRGTPLVPLSTGSLRARSRSRHWQIASNLKNFICKCYIDLDLQLDTRVTTGPFSQPRVRGSRSHRRQLD